MKALKFLAVALLATFAVEGASAQIFHRHHRHVRHHYHHRDRHHRM